MTETSGSDETPSTTRQAIRDGIDDAYAKASKTAHAAVERTKDGIEQARDKVSDVYSSGLDKASEVYASARRKTADGVDSTPLAMLLGGIAIGAVLGALLPRTARETKVLGAVGEKVRSAAGDAIEAAKGAGRDKLDELGLSREHARDTMKSLLDGAIAAAGSAGAAAIGSARKKDA